MLLTVTLVNSNVQNEAEICRDEVTDDAYCTHTTIHTFHDLGRSWRDAPQSAANNNSRCLQIVSGERKGVIGFVFFFSESTCQELCLSLMVFVVQ